MRISCEIRINNRQLPSLNLSANKKGARASLAIGKKPGKPGNAPEMYFHVCTLQNKEGNKYKIHNNIQAVFTKFLNEGKFTIQLKEPPFDLCIKAEERLGKEFLKVLKMVLKNNNVDKIPLSHLNPVKQSQIEKPKFRVQISSMKEYPITSNFPYSLEQLAVHGIGLKTVEKKITSLKRLSKLDLSDNKIAELPRDLASMNHLAVLNMSGNKLECISEDIFNGKIKETLVYLDLSRNELQSLPKSIVKLKKINTLTLKENKIKNIPHRIHRLRNLRHLNVSHNLLQFIPSSVFDMQLDTLDISRNPLDKDISGNPLNGGRGEFCAIVKKLPSLRELSGLSVLQNGRQLSPADIPQTLCTYLDQYLICMCGKIVLESYFTGFISRSLRSLPSYQSEKSIVSSLAVFCSRKCSSKFYSVNYL